VLSYRGAVAVLAQLQLNDFYDRRMAAIVAAGAEIPPGEWEGRLEEIARRTGHSEFQSECLANGCPTITNVGRYTLRVHQAARRRMVMAKAGRLHNVAAEATGEELVARSRQILHEALQLAGQELPATRLTLASRPALVPGDRRAA
jgi:hypothetical protein